ncbi:GntR family transcriptional regulator [Roseovarius sp.]|uniref:GntR family transcriptional regulator n=1 Tax=Roseovarius sp. TaxID=1486281 RepID=UPI0025D22AAA|nr:GntR family transcriptional regulator [Roseovarius sp.]
MQQARSSSKRTAVRDVHSTAIAADLETEIVTGVIGAGSRLDEQSLTQRFGVSRTPVREALHILVARSLAERLPYRGVVVADITRERIEQMFEAMGEVEALCGRFAAERMTIGERGRLDELHKHMSDIATNGTSADYEAANTDFHAMIYAGTRNEDIEGLADTLRLKLAPFRKTQLQSPDRMARSNEEHTAIVSAILEKNTKAAERALRRHLVRAAREVLSRMK